jgi:deazaflavin-dependent oxidoreductase (nitroreductase family)
MRDNAWTWLNRAFKGHVFLYRATRGVIGHRFPFAPPMLLVDNVGAKTGRKLTTPLAYMPDDGTFVVVASKGANPRNPAWYHNLMKNPDTTIQVGSRRMQARAHVATPEERKRLWPKAAAFNNVWGRYQEKTDREIPLVILEPRP